MPYIDEKDRDFYEDELGRLRSACISGNTTVGDINYIITSLIHEWIKEHKLCYESINAMIGVLACAQAELYRQIAAPYEDQKKKENGPVSELDKE